MGAPPPTTPAGLRPDPTRPELGYAQPPNPNPQQKGSKLFVQ